MIEFRRNAPNPKRNNMAPSMAAANDTGKRLMIRSKKPVKPATAISTADSTGDNLALGARSVWQAV
jgi:hypothetical protein